MWIQRTPAEVARWHAATKREARFHGLLLGGLCWLGISALLAGGWIAGGRFGVAAQQSVGGGTFSNRFPLFAAAGLPIAYWFFRRESRKELERSLQMTICPKCETAGEGNAELECPCGGKFVLQSTVRWVDDTEVKEQKAHL